MSGRRDDSASPAPTAPPASAPTNVEGELARLLRQQEQRALDPWRIDAQRYEAEAAAYAAIGDEKTARMAVGLAKARRLSPADVMTLSYTVFGSPQALKFYSHVLMQKTGTDRVRAHNHFVARACGEEFLRQWGSKLASLAYPLFPAGDDAFNTLNIILLGEESEVVGGSSRRSAPSVFKPEPQPEGAGYLAPVIDVDGHAAVDLGPAESAVIALQRRVAQLERRVTEQPQNRGDRSARGASTRSHRPSGDRTGRGGGGRAASDYHPSRGDRRGPRGGEYEAPPDDLTSTAARERKDFQ